MYKYKAVFEKVKKVEIVRETEKSVFLPYWNGAERREAKKTDWYSYHDTAEDAIHAVIKRAESEVEKAEKELTSKIGKLEAIKRKMADLDLTSKRL